MVPLINSFVYQTKILVGGGDNSGNINTIQWFNGETAGNSQNYGQLTLARYWLSSTFLFELCFRSLELYATNRLFGF